jgi:density-regulated protein DRP1
LIKRIERTKRKCVTTIYGLDIFGVDLKKAAKMFANRFACGSSVAKNNQGQDEIVVQGDFSDELLKMILNNWPNVSHDECKVYLSNSEYRFLRRTLIRLRKKRRKRLKLKFSVQ